MEVLIGSTAARYWFSDFREPHDIDYVTQGKSGRQDNVEFLYHPGVVERLTAPIATPNELYTIKASHAFWVLRHSWEKHMSDILFFQNKECQIIDDLFDFLYTVWEERHGKKKANLNVSAEDFFNKRVVRKYDHDSIHASIAYHDRPLYEAILRDGSEVMVDKSKFDALYLEDKYRLVREEVYATALERVLIPADYNTSPRAGYAFAMKKTITSFSKGWFPRFIVENYSNLYRPDCDYVQRHLDNKHKLITLEG